MLPYKKPNLSNDSTDAWLITYADMITLLLCFFVILISTSSVKLVKFEQLEKEIKTTFSNNKKASPYISIVDRFDSLMDMYQLHTDMQVSVNSDAIVVEIRAGDYFPMDSAELSEEGKWVIQQVAQVFRDAGYEGYTIAVEGHTDNAPVTPTAFPSHWELSAARASAVVRFLISEGMAPELLRATGYGDTQPKFPNLDWEGKPILQNQALNRRIVLRLERK